MSDIVQPWIMAQGENDNIPTPPNSVLTDGLHPLIGEAISLGGVHKSNLESMESRVIGSRNTEQQNEEGTVFLFWHDENDSPAKQEVKYGALPLRTHVYLAAYFDYTNPQELKTALKEVYKIMLQKDMITENDSSLKGIYSVVLGKVINLEEKLNFQL